jgi:hypothetical protein
LELHIRFKLSLLNNTSEQILFAVGDDTDGDYLRLVVGVDGCVSLRVDLGTGALTLTDTSHPVRDTHWHDVHLHRYVHADQVC